MIPLFFIFPSARPRASACLFPKSGIFDRMKYDKQNVAFEK
jgi:hypothetical protein